MTSIHPARAKDGKPKPNGAWSPEEVDFLTESIQKGSFHVLCPDNETLREVDMARMQWNISDIIEDRQTLSRWLDEWEPKFSECMGAAAIHQKPRSIGRTFHCSRGPDVLAVYLIRLTLTMKLLLSLLALASAVVLPAAQVVSLPSGADPALSLPQALLDSKLYCPRRTDGSYKGIKNPLLLVPGTGTTGAESWDPSLAKLAPSIGFDPCYISPEPYLLNDTTKSVDYFVNAVRRLHAESGKAVPVAGWSQGNLIVQVGLTFFPQVREKDANFVSLAGDFRGTTNGIIYDISSNKQVPAVIWQQAADSQIFTALANAGGLTAIVPTTSIYSSSDEIVKPENNSTSATSYLAGATNVLAQKYCPGISLFHGGMLYSNFSMSVAKGALTSPSKVWNPSTFTKGYCGGYVADGLSGSDKDKVQFLIFKDAIRMSSSKYAIPCEPLLPAYIKKYAAANPPCHAKISSFLAL
ncbi:hypothetical protein CF336_g6762 [Tilletia laevis]|nr:hypothetical protein CF336_g6762 [Tilletia laevis]KAE8190946.1 hypothetical protein CF335_g6219 [Tilletia laevis]CAD7060991.1 unnamed protein product [Tilletia caries]